jgi:hypothetical protein
MATFLSDNQDPIEMKDGVFFFFRILDLMVQENQ